MEYEEIFWNEGRRGGKRKDMFALTGTVKNGLNVTEVTTWTYLAGVGKRNIFV